MAMQRLIFDSDHDMFRDQVRRFFQKEIAPHGEAWRERGYVDREAFLKAGEQGYLLMYAEMCIRDRSRPFHGKTLLLP